MKKIIIVQCVMAIFIILCTNTVLLAGSKNITKRKTFAIKGIVTEFSLGNAVGSLVVKNKKMNETDFVIYPNNYKIFGAKDVEVGDFVRVKYIANYIPNDKTITGKVVSIRVYKRCTKCARY